METFNDLMALWPSHQELADDAGVSVNLVRVWRYRGNIPAGRWLSIVRGAQARGLEGITTDRLAAIAERMIESTGDKLESIILDDFTPGNGGEK